MANLIFEKETGNTDRIEVEFNDQSSKLRGQLTGLREYYFDKSSYSSYLFDVPGGDKFVRLKFNDGLILDFQAGSDIDSNSNYLAVEQVGEVTTIDNNHHFIELLDTLAFT